jgi:hypothetical protein
MALLACGFINTVIMSLICISAAYRAPLRATLRVRGVRGVHASAVLLHAKKEEDKIIDAEFYDPNERAEERSQRKKSYKIERDASGSVSGSGSEGGGGGLLSSIGTGIAKLLRVDEESKRKKAEKAKLNAGIDKMLQGTGMAGSIIGKVMKGVGGLVMDQLKDSMGAIGAVQDAARHVVELDGALGSGVQVGMPMQQSSSSSNVNGVVTKTVFLVFPVQGQLGGGQVEADATLAGKDNDVTFRSLTLTTQTGKRITLSGRGRGGGGGAGQTITVEGRDV